MRFGLPVPTEGDLSDVPDTLAQHVAAGQLELLVESTDLPIVISELLEWAQANDRELAGLEVAPPILEDTYLQLTQQHHQPLHAEPCLSAPHR